MKKTILSLVVTTVFLAPSLSHAQVEVDNQVLLRSMLQQVIALLTQQMEVLVAQLAEMRKIKPIETPVVVTPQPVVPVVISPQISGTITPMPIDKSEILVIQTDETDYGSFNFKIAVLDKDGKHVQNAPVRLETENPNSKGEAGGKNPNFSKTTNGQSEKDSNDWNTSFEYVPSSKGTKTLTFTSGSLTKTVTVEVE